MRIETNLPGVMGQLRRLRAHVPVAAGRALHPDVWGVYARGVAERTMGALAKPEERRHIPLFLATFEALVFPPEGLSLLMSKPGPEAGPRLRLPEQLLGAEHVGAAGEWGPYMFAMPIPEFKELILKWVETAQENGGKRRDARDAEKTDEEIAAYVADVMLSPNKQAQDARRRLLPHILGWLKKTGEEFGWDPKDPESHAGEAGFLDLINGDELTAATVDLWLRAVLAAWIAIVCGDGFGQRFRQELVKMRDEL